MTLYKRFITILLALSMVLCDGSVMGPILSYAETAADPPAAATSEVAEPAKEDTADESAKEEKSAKEADKDAEKEKKSDSAKEDALKQQEIKAELIQEPLFEDGLSAEDPNAKETKALKRSKQFWQALLDREIPATDKAQDLKVIVSGMLPKGITAECRYIPLKDSAAHTEKGLASFVLRLYDAEGQLYIPEEPVTVTVQGVGLTDEIEAGNAPILYAYEKNKERAEAYEEKYDKGFYAADVIVFKSEDVRKKLLNYEKYDEEKDYKDGEDAVRYSNDKDGLTCEKDAIRFEYDFGAVPATAKAEDPDAVSDGIGHFLLTSQEAPKKEEAEAKAEQKAEKADAPAEKKDTEREAAEQKTADKKAAEQKAEEKQAAAKKDADKKDNEQKTAEKKVAAKGQTLTAGDGKTYKISVAYGRDAGIPGDAVLMVTDLSKDFVEYSAYVNQAADKMGKEREDLSFAHAFDIKLVDPKTGEEYQPNEKVRVSIDLLKEDLTAEENVSVVHFKAGDAKEQSETGAQGAPGASALQGAFPATTPAIDTHKAELLNAGIVDGAVEFTTDGFSVYVVAGYTVDFHWGEYTYSIEGEGDIYLSELLKELARSERSDAEQLKALAGDMSRVKDVTFSDPKLVKVEQKSSKQAENDWLLTSRAAFQTEETLILALIDGKKIVIDVTDAGAVCRIGTTTYATLGDAFNAAMGTTCTIEMLADCEISSNININTRYTNITLTTAESYPRGTATISRANTFTNASMFTLNAANSGLTMENIQIDGRDIEVKNNVFGSLIDIETGAFTMNDGAVLKNGFAATEAAGTTKYGRGGGVGIGTSNGAFIMNGGEIVGCKAAHKEYFAGGGVCLYHGNFTMNGGMIRDCHATAAAGNGWNGGWGGGLAVNHGEAAYMTGGLITGCTATKGGAAVECHEDLYMTGGTITGNYGGTKDGKSGAVNFYDTGSRLFVHGSPKIYGNYDVNGNYNDVAIRTTGGNITVDGDMNEDAIIGVNKEGIFNPDEQFGKYTPETIPKNLNVFFADTDDTLVGMGFKYNNSAEHGRWLIWARGIKVVAKMYTDDPDDAIEIKGSRGSFTTIGDFDGTTSESERTVTLAIKEAERQYRTTKGYGDYLSLVDSDDPSSTFQFARKEGGTNDNITYLRSKLTRQGTVRTFYNYYSINESSLADPNRINQNQFTDLAVGDTITLYYKVSPKVKITDADGNLLAADSFGNPAIFGKLETAFSHVSKIYKNNSGTYTSYSAPMQIKMLVSEYEMGSGVAASGDYDVTLTTAGTGDAEFPGPGGTSVIKNKSITDKSMISTSLKDLSLDKIKLDGANKTTSADGAIINVNKSGAVLTINNGASLVNGNTSGKGGAVFVADGASMTMNGGSITGNKAENGGAVNVGGASARLIFSGNAVISGNPGNGQKKNVVLDQDTAGIIRTAGSGLSSSAGIGIYVEGDKDAEGSLFAKRGASGKVFGTYESGADANLDGFVNDRNSFFAEKGDNAGEIRWAKNDYIARVKSNDGEWKYFDYLINTGLDGNGDYKGAFNYANAQSGEVVIETLKKGKNDTEDDTLFEGESVGRYTLTSGFIFNNAGINSLTIRTADSVGERSTLTKNQSGTIAPMITFNVKNAPFMVEDLVFDGKEQKTSGTGGAVSMTNGTTLAVNRCHFHDFQASGNGGAVYQGVKELLTVRDSSFKNCETTVSNGGANGGGALYSAGGILLENTTDGAMLFEGCSSKAQGGAIHANGAQITINNNNGGTIRFEDCTTYSDGGAVSTQGMNLAISNNGTILFDTCVSTEPEEGGAINTDGGNITIDNAAGGAISFTECRSSKGGAIHTAGNLTVADNAGVLSFESCTSEGDGGAVYAGSLTITNKGVGTLTVKDNSAGGSGGAFCVSNNTTITATEDQFIRFENCHATGSGGAIWSGKNTNITNVIFGDSTNESKRCYSGNQGGSVFSNDGPIVYTNTTDREIGAYYSRAASTGGAFCLGSGGTKTTSITINNKDSGTVAFENCEITGGSSGGAFWSHGDVQIDDNNGIVRFKDLNKTGGGSGAGAVGSSRNIYMDNNTGSIIFDNCKLTKGGSGGAIYASGNISAMNNAGEISFNECAAKSSGGAVYVGGDLSIINTNTGKASFVDCSAPSGGGIHGKKNITLEAHRDGELITFETCKATGTSSAGGGAIRHESGTMQLTNVTFGEKNNQAKACTSACYGGAIYGSGSGRMIYTNTTNKEIGFFYTADAVSAASTGGTIYATNSYSVEVSNTHEVGIIAFDRSHIGNASGGAVYLDGGTFSVNGNKGTIYFNDCYTKGGSCAGGAVCAKGGFNSANNSGTVRFSDCKAGSNHGGAIYTEGTGVKAENNTGSFLFERCSAPGYGGAIYTTGTNCEISGSGKMRFEDCTSNGTTGAGGVVSHRGSGKFEFDNASFIRSIGMNTTNNDNNKGAVIYTASADATLKSCTIYAGETENDIAAGAKFGGAVCHENAAGSISLIDTKIYGFQSTVNNSQGGGVWSNGQTMYLQDTIIKYCKAKAIGGGIYSEAKTVGIHNTLTVTENSIDNTTITNAGGVYFKPEDTVITVTSDTDEANIWIYGNKMSNGKESNLHMGIGAPGIEVKGIKTGGLTGKVGVVNPAVMDRWFGRSTAHRVCGDPTIDHTPDGKEVEMFKDDTETYFAKYQGILQRRLIWAPLPNDGICKITDENGNLLYYDFGDGKQEAVFGTLADAFGAYAEWADDPATFTRKDGTTAVKPANIEMLVTSYTQAMILFVPDGTDTEPLPLTLKTASATAPDNLHPGPGSVCKISRGNFGGSMYVMDGADDFTVTSITMDGGNKTDATYNQNGGIIRADGANCQLKLLGGDTDNGGFDCTLQNSKITGHNGGAVYMADGGSFAMQDGASIRNCSTNGNGGAVYLDGSTHPVASITDSSITDCKAANGGFVYSEAAALSVSGSTFTWSTPTADMTTGNGGMFYIGDVGTASLQVKNSDFMGFRAGNNGGAIYCASNGTVDITDSSFERNQDNYRAAANGGAIFMNKSGAKLNVSGDTLFSHLRAGVSGGAIYANTGVAVSLTGSGSDKVMFDFCNQADSGDGNRGGAVYCNGTLNVKDLKLKDCHAGYSVVGNPTSSITYYTGRGGAIAMGSSGKAVLEDVTITGCSAFMGGAIYTENTTASALKLINTSITGNALNPNVGARNQAAGVYMPNNSTLTIGDGSGTDTTAIKDNATSQGEPSNLRLSMTGVNNTAASLSVLSLLSDEIHVVNPGTNGTQFGTKAAALGDTDNNVDRQIYTDFAGRTVQLDRTDNKLYWLGEYVCKITDASGNTLTYKGADAVFNTLTEAYAAFATGISGAKNIEIFRPYYDQTGYTNTPVYVMEAGIAYPNKTLDVTLKTAAETAPDGKYPYVKNDTKAWAPVNVLRGNTDRGASMFTLNYNNNVLRLCDIVLDGQGDRGQFKAGNGGAVYLNGTASLHMENADNTANNNCSIKNGRASDNGGGVYANSATAINWAVFDTCMANNGGGVYGNAALTLGDGTFDSCTGTNGGGVYALTTMTMNGTSSFDSCTATNGGGIYAIQTMTAKGPLVLRSCIATSNGGGICLPSQHNFFRHSITGGADFTDCVATNGSGGGLYCYSDDAGSWGRGLTLGGDVTFTGCSAGGSGGGMYKGVGGSTYGYLTLNENTRIVAKGCRAVNNGGGIDAECLINMNKGVTLLFGGEAEGEACTAGGSGGGFYHGSDTINATAANIDFTVIRCTAGSNGGGLFVNNLNAPGADITLTACTATANGGGLYANGSLTAGKKLQAVDCIATNGMGGGACVYHTFTANNHPVFTNCTAGTHGGGLALPSQHNFFRHSITGGADFTDCVATNGSGGGLYCYSDDAGSWGRGLTLGGELVFTDCNAGGSGGGMYKGLGGSSHGYLTLNENTVIAAKNCHAASGSGGGVFTNCLINMGSGVSIHIGGEAEGEECTAGGSGGGFYHGSDTINATAANIDFTVIRCTAGSNGGGLFVNNMSAGGADLTVKTCTAASNGGGIFANGYLTAGRKLELEDCTATNGMGGGACVYQTFTANSHPVFTNCTAGTHGGGISLPSQHNFFRHSITGGAAFTDCVATTGSGGGLYCYSDDAGSWGRALTLGGEVAFADCSAGGSGGGMYKGLGNSSYGYFTLQDNSSIIAKSCHADGNGGGIFLNTALNINSTHRVVFESCSANNGGALYANNTTSVIMPATGSGEENEFRCADCSAVQNGGALWFGNTATLTNVTIDGHTEDGLAEDTKNAAKGAGIYLNNGSLTLKGGSIQHCSASDTNGGAINVNGVKNVYFEGDVVVRNNPDGEVGTQQKNMVLEQDNNTIIRTTTNGLGKDAWIGIYVVDTQFNNHGKRTMNFGTYTNSAGGKAYLDRFHNDVNGLTGEVNPDTNYLIRWFGPICKVTDENGNLLYYKDSDSLKPCVLSTLKGSVDKANGALYRYNSAEQADPNDALPTYPCDGTETPVGMNEPVIVKMLDDLEIKANHNWNETTRDLTFSTAETARADIPAGNADSWIYSGAAKDTDGRAILTKAYNGIMFTVNTAKKFTARELHIDGKSASYNTGSAFQISNASEPLFEDMTFVSCKANSGSAILNNANIALTIEDVIFGAAKKDENGVIMLDSKNNPIVDKDKVCLSTGTGGAIYSSGNLTVRSTEGKQTAFYGCYTVNNNAHGGAIRALRNVSFDNNAGTLSFIGCHTSAYGGDGGAVYLNENSGSFSARNNKGTITFDNCTSLEGYSDQGGAICAVNGSIDMTCIDEGRISFRDCGTNAKNDTYGGGALCVWNPSTAHITLAGTASNPIVFENCYTNNGSGGAVFCRGEVNLTNVRFGALELDKFEKE